MPTATTPERPASPDQLDELLHVTTPQGWLALLALGGLLAVGLLWAVFATIPTTVSGDGVLGPTDSDDSSLQALVFVSPEDALKLLPGMAVKVTVATVKTDEYGLLLGTVRVVDTFASDQRELVRLVGSDTFAQSLAAQGTLVAVRIDLARDPGTATGYKWSARTGPPTRLEVGMLCHGQITIADQHPISLLLP